MDVFCLPAQATAPGAAAACSIGCPCGGASVGRIINFKALIIGLFISQNFFKKGFEIKFSYPM
jgi:hypothetical protein